MSHKLSIHCLSEVIGAAYKYYRGIVGDLESIFACPGVRLGFLVSAAVQISKCVAVICMGAVALCLSISMETSFKQLVNMIRYGTTA